MTEQAKCELCGEPMPEGETMFKFHGYSGPCPKPPLPKCAHDWTIWANGDDPPQQMARCLKCGTNHKLP